MPLQWSEQYSTGVLNIDAQHRQLFQMVNDLEDRLRRGEGPEQMARVLDGLSAYTHHHFGCEEKLMDEHKCPTACINKMAHQRFLRLVQSQVADAKAGRATRETFQTLHGEIADWLREHICKIDLRLREAVPVAG